MQSSKDSITKKPEATSSSPGQLLKQAREQRQLSQADVAGQLKLRVQWIVDIENDHFSDGSALVYVRGYLRSYAKLMQLDPERILARFEQMNLGESLTQRKMQEGAIIEDVLAAPATALPFYKTSLRRPLNTKMNMLMGVAAGIAVLVVALFWWRGEHAAIKATGDNLSVSLPAGEATAVTPDQTTQSNQANQTDVNAGENAAALALPKLDEAPPAPLKSSINSDKTPPANGQLVIRPVPKASDAESLPPVEELPGTDVSR
jgi:cytoskeleton protein RodZ